MSIVMNMSWAGVTAADYDRIAEEVKFREDVADGGRYHFAWPTESGFRVVDVWDSAEHFESFVQNRLMPGVQKLGIPGEPEVTILPLYDLQIEGEPAAGSVVADGMGGEGTPADAYKALERTLNWKEHPPAGACVHVVALDGDTIRDAGIWASAEALETFVAGPVAGALADMGADQELEDEPIHALHAWFDPTKVDTSA